MANLNETDEWAEGVYQIEEDDPVLGGPAGITNHPPRQIAGRTLYQRLRNITPWIATLAYPANVAYISHGATTWKSVAASTGVEPGTDATKWVRWAYTAVELAAAMGDAIEQHVSDEDPHQQYAFWSALAAVIGAAGIAPDRGAPAQLLTALRTSGVIKGGMRFTSNGTFVVPDGVTAIWLSGCGGGGGGGSAGSSTTSLVSSGGGGGGAGYGRFMERYDVTPGSVLTITIGAGGAGAAANAWGNPGNGGGNGGDTSVAGLIVGTVDMAGGTGGFAGTVNATSAAGGAGGLGYAWGGTGADVGVNNVASGAGGAGGSGMFGGGAPGGRGSYGSSVAGVAATGAGAHGGGGGGGGGSYGAVNANGGIGGAGAPGFVQIMW